MPSSRWWLLNTFSFLKNISSYNAKRSPSLYTAMYIKYVYKIQAMIWIKLFHFHPVVGNGVAKYQDFFRDVFLPDRMILLSYHSDIQLDNECSLQITHLQNWTKFTVCFFLLCYRAFWNFRNSIPLPVLWLTYKNVVTNFPSYYS